MTQQIKNAAHVLKDQLEAFVQMVEKREAAAKQPWVDTELNMTEDEAQERLAVLKDKWHRENL